MAIEINCPNCGALVLPAMPHTQWHCIERLKNYRDKLLEESRELCKVLETISEMRLANGDNLVSASYAAKTVLKGEE